MLVEGFEKVSVPPSQLGSETCLAVGDRKYAHDSSARISGSLSTGWGSGVFQRNS